MDKEYRYREGVNGEHCIDYGTYEWKMIDTVGRAATKADAITLIAELNTVVGGTNAKLR
jgi:hypothetical protein